MKEGRIDRNSSGRREIPMNRVLRQTRRKDRGGRTTRSQQRDKAIVSIRKRRVHTRKPSQEDRKMSRSRRSHKEIRKQCSQTSDRSEHEQSQVQKEPAEAPDPKSKDWQNPEQRNYPPGPQDQAEQEQGRARSRKEKEKASRGKGK